MKKTMITIFIEIGSCQIVYSNIAVLNLVVEFPQNPKALIVVL